jgi:putative endonuclease
VSGFCLRIDRPSLARPGSSGAGLVLKENKMSISRHSFDDPVALAAEYLQRSGFQVLDSKWKCDLGEIAIVAVDRQVFVACEVKTRSGTRYGTPLEAAGRARQRRLRRLAVAWLDAHGGRYDRIRIDIIGLVHEGTGGYTIEHIRAVG